MALFSCRMKRTAWGSEEKVRDRIGALPDFRVRKTVPHCKMTVIIVLPSWFCED